jgi:hypothetical protein
VDGIEGVESGGLELAGSEQEVSIHDELVQGIEMGESDFPVTVDRTNGPQNLSEGELTGYPA